MPESTDDYIVVRNPTHLRKLGRNRTIMVDASPKFMHREIIHAPITIQGRLMMLDVARINEGTLTASTTGRGLFLYLHIPDEW